MSFISWVFKAIFFSIVAAFVLAAIVPKDKSGERETLNPTCVSDWRKCKDNSDLVNNFSNILSIQSACKRAADDQAKYGTPEWPWLAFSSFYQGASYIDTGTVIVIEKKAKFQNIFGAMASATVTCMYDLKSKSIITVEINQN